LFAGIQEGWQQSRGGSPKGAEEEPNAGAKPAPKEGAALLAPLPNAEPPRAAGAVAVLSGASAKAPPKVKPPALPLGAEANVEGWPNCVDGEVWLLKAKPAPWVDPKVEKEGVGAAGCRSAATSAAPRLLELAP
jgi:hypothetical protein